MRRAFYSFRIHSESTKIMRRVLLYSKTTILRTDPGCGDHVSISGSKPGSNPHHTIGGARGRGFDSYRWVGSKPGSNPHHTMGGPGPVAGSIPTDRWGSKPGSNPHHTIGGGRGRGRSLVRFLPIGGDRNQVRIQYTPKR